MSAKKGFTLVELLIVVLLLGIIAAIALPKFSNASAMARASMLADDLRVLRIQILVFKSQHRSVSPGYPGCDTNAAPTEAAFIEHMTKASNAAGDTAPPRTSGYPFGPYMREMPLNPVNGKNTVQIVGDSDLFPASAGDSYGWIYQPSTLLFKADATGADETGKNYIDY